MAIRIRLPGMLLLTLAAGCVDDPLQSAPTSATLSLPGGPTSFDPNPTTGSTGESTTGEAGSTGTTGSTGSTSTTTTAESTAAVEMCGDGILGPGEECDLGAMNANTGACTLACELATCGDGLVQPAVGEQCDFGLGNSDAYGGCLPDSCQFGPRCGDGVLDAQHESCDRGELNGSGQTLDDYAPCSLTCGFSGRVIFVTNKVFKGDLGGVAGGDLRCRAAATDAGLPHPDEYRAWLSDDGLAPIDRFAQWDYIGVPLMLVDGRVVADDLPNLASNGPRIGISLTEHREALFQALTWTNTSGSGEVFSATQHCFGWTSADGTQFARRGVNGLADENGPNWQSWRDERWWTSYHLGQCDKFARLFCIDDTLYPEL